LEKPAIPSTTWLVPTQQIPHNRSTAGSLEDNLVFSFPRLSRPRLKAKFLLSRPRNSSEEAWEASLLHLCFLL
jgi:hypothetical protein